MSDAEALANVSAEALAKRAEAIAADIESEERWKLVAELHGRCSEDVFRLGTRWLSSPQGALRCLGADLLGQLGHTDAHSSRSPFGEKSTPLLINALSDSDPQVLDSVIVALGHLANWGMTWDASLLSELAGHPEEDVRHAVAFALGGVRCDDSEEAVRIMLELMSDRRAYVRDWATFGLGVQSSADGAAIREALLERLADGDLDTRAEAILALALRSEPRAIDAIVDALGDPDLEARALEAISEFPHPAFVPPLEEHLERDGDDPFIAELLVACREAAPAS